MTFNSVFICDWYITARGRVRDPTVHQCLHHPDWLVTAACQCVDDRSLPLPLPPSARDPTAARYPARRHRGRASAAARSA